MADKPISSSKTGLATSQSLIQSITPRGSEAVDVGTITAFVGPNNSGKTETLRDVLRLAANFDLLATDRSRDEEPQPVILSDLTFVPKLSVERMMIGLTVVDPDSAEGTLVQSIGPNLQTPHRRAINKDLRSILSRPIMTARSVWMTSLGDLMLLRSSYVGAEDHQRLVAPTSAVSPMQGPENLLQLLHYADPSIHEELDAAFSEAFVDQHIKLDASQQVDLTLRVGPSFPNELDDPIANVRQYQQFHSLDEEGAAYQSYAAVVLSLLLGQGRIIVLDQPAAGLRPEQAQRLGRWIANQALKLSCQVFIATSNVALLKGLSEGQADLAIIRLSRNNEITRFLPVPGPAGNYLAKFPLFASQDALKLLFCDGVVVTPESGDRVIYETVANRFCSAQNIGFIEALGVQNVYFVMDALRQCGLPVCSVVELEVFGSDKFFTELVKSATGSPPPQPWLATRERLASHVEGWFDQESLSADAHEVEDFLDQVKQGEPSTQTETREVTATDAARNWRKLRTERLEWLPRELRIWVEELIEDLKRSGVFVSPKGRLLAWMEFDAENRVAWLNQAMQSLHQGQCPAELRAFVGDLVTYLQSRSAPTRATRLSDRT
jgi:hypothetical protein